LIPPGSTGRAVLIAGGEGKGADFSPLRSAVKRTARAVVLIGRDAELIAQALDGEVPLVEAAEHAGCGRSGGGDRPARRYGSPLAGLRQFRYVRQLRASRAGLRRGGTGARDMTLAARQVRGDPARSALRRRERSVAGVDYPLLVCALGLVAFGVVMVASASMSIAANCCDDPFYYVTRHGLALGLALTAAVLAYSVPVDWWERGGVWLFLLGLLSLVLVLVPGVGREVNGATRWIPLGPLNLQPSELVKLFAIIYVSGYLVRHADDVVNRISGFIRPMLLIGIAGALILQQPDFGTTAVMLATVMGLLFLGGVSVMPFVVCSWSCRRALGAGLISPYRLQRVTSFLDPWEDPFNTGYQLSQALIAFGRGEWLGVGLGNGIQKQFFPSGGPYGLHCIGRRRGARPGRDAGVDRGIRVPDLAGLLDRGARGGRRRAFAAYVAQGIGLGLGLQAFVNIGVNVGMLPTKGLTLPFMSYGSNSLIAACMAIAILLRIDAMVRRIEAEKGPHGGCHGYARSRHGRGHRRACLSRARGRRAPARAGHGVFWIGTRRGMESRLVPEHGLEMEWIRIEGCAAKGSLRSSAHPSRSRLHSGRPRILRRRRPSVVLGMGGFASGPGGLAARVLGLPLVIHEQNFVPGMTNQWLARIATRVFEAFPGSFPGARGRNRLRKSGAPRDRRSAAAARASGAAPRGRDRRAASAPGPGRLPRGSGPERDGPRGAGGAAAGAASERAPSGRRAHARDRADGLSRGRCRGEVTPFIQDMAEAYGWADLVVCRAGALTVSELAAAGVASVLVPYPFAVDDHQVGNARYLADVGAARLVIQRDLTVAGLTALLMNCWAIASPARDGRCGPRARQPDAAGRIAAACLGGCRSMNAHLQHTAARMGRVRRLHFVGIGGSGMSGIAELMANLGYEVAGSDLRESDARAASRGWASRSSSVTGPSRSRMRTPSWCPARSTRPTRDPGRRAGASRSCAVPRCSPS
jgi:cell division protein FtsW